MCIPANRYLFARQILVTGIQPNAPCLSQRTPNELKRSLEHEFHTIPITTLVNTERHALDEIQAAINYQQHIDSLGGREIFIDVLGRMLLPHACGFEKQWLQLFFFQTMETSEHWLIADTSYNPDPNAQRGRARFVDAEESLPVLNLPCGMHDLCIARFVSTHHVKIYSTSVVRQDGVVDLMDMTDGELQALHGTYAAVWRDHCPVGQLMYELVQVTPAILHFLLAELYTMWGLAATVRPLCRSRRRPVPTQSLLFQMVARQNLR